MIRKQIVIKWAFVSQLIFVLLCLSGCNSFTSFNVKTLEEPGNSPKLIRATINDIHEGYGRQKNSLVILALSGGGSRAAYWSASVMFKLGDLLKDVDVISAVSGGSLPAAYYATSFDSKFENPNRVWNENFVKELMSRQYLTQWGWNLFHPITFVKVNFTNYDRTDVMAQTLADNLFDKPGTDMNLQFRDMNPKRPYLIINATRANITEKLDTTEPCMGTEDMDNDKTFGEVFTFTEESFLEIKSDLASYDISKAVMASATFPGLYNNMTLQDFRKSDIDSNCNRYIHLVDGGNLDNLGLRTVREIINKHNEQYNNIIVILIDSYTDVGGWSSEEDNPRKLQGWGLDPNIFHAIDSLLSSTRESEIQQTMDTLQTFVDKDVIKKSIFYHIEFKDVGSNKDLFARLNKIPTSFNIEKEHVKSIDDAVELLFNDPLKESMDIKEERNTCLHDIANLIWHNQANNEILCKYTNANKKY